MSLVPLAFLVWTFFLKKIVIIKNCTKIFLEIKVYRIWQSPRQTSCLSHAFYFFIFIFFKESLAVMVPLCHKSTLNKNTLLQTKFCCPGGQERFYVLLLLFARGWQSRSCFCQEVVFLLASWASIASQCPYGCKSRPCVQKKKRRSKEAA